LQNKVGEKSVLPGVRLINVQLYSLQVNGETICEVTADVPVWLPPPKLDRKWLRGVVAMAISHYFSRRKAAEGTRTVPVVRA